MKVKTRYSCRECGQISPKWLGQCTACQSWNTLEEETNFVEKIDDKSLNRIREDHRKSDSAPLLLEDISEVDSRRRYKTPYSELNRVLGGGLVPDSFTLLGGDPGIGKSTLLLQTVGGLLREYKELIALYVSGEESAEQIRGRALRLGIQSDRRLYLSAESQLEKVFTQVQELKPQILIMDSLQTFSTLHSQSSPGSPSQMREVTARLMALAKSAGIAIWIVGHVTKEGMIAGPKMVEHMVDTVLYFEGEAAQNFRLLRTVKNRFGSNQEIGVFEMDEEGLREVTNPSSLFLCDRSVPIEGTAVTASLEGTRPLLVELQSLVVASGLAMPRRTSVGMDASRVVLLSAILERYMGVQLAGRDLYFNVSGGLKISEPACDLGAVAAIWSSCESKPIPSGVLWVGELSLTGEVKRGSQIELRLSEGKKLGFHSIVIGQKAIPPKLKEMGLKIYSVGHVREIPSIIQALHNN